MTKKEDTIAYWLEKANEALNKATEIADATGQEFNYSVAGYGTGLTYFPVKESFTRQDAIDLLNTGRELTEAERTKVINALQNNFSEDSDWESSYEGWVSSSEMC